MEMRIYVFLIISCWLILQELSEEEKKAWNDKAAEAMEAYKKELEEYNKSVASTLEKVDS